MHTYVQNSPLFKIKPNYLAMVKKKIWSKVLRTAEYEKYYFQQDGARTHTARTVQTWLEGKFHENYIYKDM